MTTEPNLGNKIDAALKPKVTLRIEWVLVIAAVANLVGVFIHV